MIIEKYKLKDEADKTMFVFKKNNKVFGHIVKDRTIKDPAKIMYETEKYSTIEELKKNYPELEGNDGE